jgi:hypothetical protein
MMTGLENTGGTKEAAALWQIAFANKARSPYFA